MADNIQLPLPADPDPLWNYKAIGKRLGVNPRTVRRWDKLGLLPRPSFQVLALRRWRRSVIEAWISIGGSRAFNAKTAGTKVDKKGQNDRPETETTEPTGTKRDKR